MTHPAIVERISSVQKRIASACERSGRQETEIMLLGASKGQPASSLIAAAKSGLHHVGENYAQELIEKQDELITTPQTTELQWHFFGPLQRRKIRTLIERVHCFHSIDRLAVAIELDRRAVEKNLTINGLLQINLGGETTKSGCSAEQAESILTECCSLKQLRLLGLMTLPPFHEDPEKIRPYFRELRQLRDALNKKMAYKEPLRELSMGMSHDFEVAIEEGTTMIRIGTALFGERQNKAEDI